MLVDSHCHLDFPDFDGEREAVIDRAHAAGVGHMVTICTRLSRFNDIHAIAVAHDGIYCSVGVHPHEAAAEGQEDAARLVALAGRDKVVGIGETGLDYHYEHSPREAQKTSFRAHIQAARETGLPIIIHARDADTDMAGILADEQNKGAFRGVLHCFSAGPELAEAALAMGFYLSLSGIVTFKRAEDLRAIARDIPEDRLLVETDAPYLAPVPHRGGRNEPAYVADTAAELARLRDVSPAALARATTRNFFRLFDRAGPAAEPDEANSV